MSDEVDTQELRDGLANGTMVVVDVREEPELWGGVIPGSLAMPMSRFDPAGLPATSGKRIVFSCAAGVRSRAALDLSLRAGLAGAAHYPAGFKGWVAGGGPVEPWTEGC